MRHSLRIAVVDLPSFFVSQVQKEREMGGGGGGGGGGQREERGGEGGGSSSQTERLTDARVPRAFNTKNNNQGIGEKFTCAVGGV